MSFRLRTSVVGLALALQFFAFDARSEPLRIFVSEFSGQGLLGQYVMTTLFLDLSESFKSLGSPEKGVWILYGREPLRTDTHEEALLAATIPSIRADLAVWGKASSYGNGVVIQSYVSVTPLAAQREVRPEEWTLSGNIDGHPISLEIGLPHLFYDFEPFSLPNEVVEKYASPAGLPLYKERVGNDIVGYAKGAFSFDEIEADSIRIRTDAGVVGWLHFTGLGQEHVQANDFTRALIRYMRGDWRGAAEAFEGLLARPDLPQAVRVDSLLYAGATEERLGESGVSHFQAAYNLNPLDRSSTQYLIMGTLNQLLRQGRVTDDERRSLTQLVRTAGILLPPDDPWLTSVRTVVGDHKP